MLQKMFLYAMSRIVLVSIQIKRMWRQCWNCFYPCCVDDEHDLLMGSPHGDLNVTRVVAAGAFGEVLLCHTDRGERVTVKRLKDSGRATGELLALDRKLAHRNICRIRHNFQTGKDLCLIMNHYPGPELWSVLGKVSLARLENVTAGLVAGLAYLHDRDLVHRDCKPENVILLNGGDQPVLVDLGSMRTAGIRAAVEGTLEYMAPEALRRIGKTHAVCAALDAWSLGATLFAAATLYVVRTRTQATYVTWQHAAFADVLRPACALLTEQAHLRPSVRVMDRMQPDVVSIYQNSPGILRSRCQSR